MMSMPEAPVDKDDLPTAAEYDVGTTWKIMRMKSVAIPELVKQSTHDKFRLCVLASYPGHSIATFDFRQCIHVASSRAGAFG